MGHHKIGHCFSIVRVDEERPPGGNNCLKFFPSSREFVCLLVSPKSNETRLETFNVARWMMLSLFILLLLVVNILDVSYSLSAPLQGWKISGCRESRWQVEIALGETEKMLQLAKNRLDELEDYLSMPTVPPIWAQKVMLASTFRTYFTFMNMTLETRGSLDSERRKQPREALQRTILRMATIRHNVLSEKTLEVLCEDNWLQPTDLEGNTKEVPVTEKSGPNDKRKWYFDKRQSVSREQSYKRQWISGITPFWADPEQKKEGYSFVRNMARPRTAVIVINPKWVRDVNTHYYDFDRGESTFSIMRGRTYGPYQWNLDQFDVKRHLSILLAHEFTHIQALTGPYLDLDDVKIDSELKAAGVKGAYGVQNCIKLARYRPDLAAQNADNFVFLALALYLDNYDWSIAGYNRNMKHALFD